MITHLRFLSVTLYLLITPFAIPAETGTAVLEIMRKVSDIQKSNYGKNSFLLTNTGSKDIISFQLDVTHALFPDTVFDPEGLAGDSVAKPLQINRNQSTGVETHAGEKSSHYIGDGGARGYEQLVIRFNPDHENGFNPGETLGFSIDMDPNSIAGTQKAPLDESSEPRWDVGGVSGAELIGSTFEVIFADGSKASGTLFATGTQAGSHGIATEQPGNVSVELTANSKRPGESGSYSTGGPQIRIHGKPGLRVRVVVAKGFIQPVRAYSRDLADQLQNLTRQPFPANNAVEFQFADITLTGSPMDISSRFDFSGIERYDFKAHPDMPFSIDEDKVPLGITAAVIDPAQNDLPSGLATDPIYLTFE
ncbi:MAG: hypothetical protein AAF649_11430 [Verrucomicrobiota bacterium]